MNKTLEVDACLNVWGQNRNLKLKVRHRGHVEF